MLAWMGVSRVLNLTQDSEYPQGQRERVRAALMAAGIQEDRVEMVDFGSLPPALIDRAVAIVEGWLEEGELVYIHCRAGWQRSPAIAAAVLAAREGVSPADALAAVRRAKPSAEPLRQQREDLQRWWDARRRRAAPGSERTGGECQTQTPMTGQPIRRRVILTGRVQGVFFRDTLRRLAEQRRVAGWAANRADGTLEAVFEGSEVDVAELVKFCRQGPAGARVDSLCAREEQPEGLSSFQVR